MTISLQGIGVARGIAIGKAHILERGQLEISEYSIASNKVEEEVRRLENAIAEAKQQLNTIRQHIPNPTPLGIVDFIDTHILMLEDNALSQEPKRMIRELHCNAEWALKQQRDALVAVFDEMDDAYLRTRKDDVEHVVTRVQRILLQQAPMRYEEPDNRLRGYIIIAHDLTPADALLMKHHGIVAFSTECGGPTSHTAILANSLGLPCVVGLHQARRYIREDDFLIIDGSKGVILITPDEATLQFYQELQREEKRHYSELIKLKGTPSITKDGTRINLQANIELPSDFEAVCNVGASGVGLYRTEFLFMNRETLPNEEEHFFVYKDALEQLGNIPITIRTLDLGADKTLGSGRYDNKAFGSNPALGLRALRLCLKDTALFKPQLRAIIRVSALGPVKLLIPMLSNLEELYQVLQMIEEIRTEFRQKCIPFDAKMPIGGMIEVPAAAVCADIFARHLNFLSIGTNDLIQYTLAADRVNDEVGYVYDPLHPGILRLIHNVIEAGFRTEKPVSMCGEMAGNPHYVRLLLGLGLRDFSVQPAMLLDVKQIVNETNVEKLLPISQQILRSGSSMEVRAHMERMH